MSSSLSFSDGLSTKLPHPKARKRAARRCTARGRRARTSTRCTAWACSTTSTSCRSRPRTARWRTPRRGPCRGRRPPCSGRRRAPACLAPWPGRAHGRRVAHQLETAPAATAALRVHAKRAAMLCARERIGGRPGRLGLAVLGHVSRCGRWEAGERHANVCLVFYVPPDKQRPSSL